MSLLELNGIIFISAVNEQIGPTTKADLLRVAPVLVQRSVLEQGSLATCRDPNAGCVGRIRKAERAERREGSVAPGFVAPSRDEPWLEDLRNGALPGEP